MKVDVLKILFCEQCFSTYDLPCLGGSQTSQSLAKNEKKANKGFRYVYNLNEKAVPVYLYK